VCHGDVVDEGAECVGDGEIWEHEMYGGIYTPGWAICGLDAAGDIPGVDDTIGCLEGRVDALEGVVGWTIAAAPIPPSFNHASVVSENLEMKVGGAI